ncbi:MAG TPA: hypothetical protein PKV27_05525 [Ilumatobacteraceae bacterium]|nr:hypothetical protein [Ilumatobacteraceae bacterium]
MTSAPDAIARIDTRLAQLAASGTSFVGSVHLHCTDDGLAPGRGEWLIRGADDAVTLTREHAKGDAAMRGSAAGLLGVLDGQAGLDTIDVIGDPAAVEALLRALA